MLANQHTTSIAGCPCLARSELPCIIACDLPASDLLLPCRSSGYPGSSPALASLQLLDYSSSASYPSIPAVLAYELFSFPVLQPCKPFRLPRSPGLSESLNLWASQGSAYSELLDNSTICRASGLHQPCEHPGHTSPSSSFLGNFSPRAS